MVVRAYSGLMSRVRMIYDAYLTTKKYEKNPKLIIMWESESGCNIHYDDVFLWRGQLEGVNPEIVEVDKGGYWEWKSVHKSILQGKILEAFSEIRHRIHIKKIYKFYSKGCEIVRYNDCPDADWNSDFSIYNEWKEKKWKQIEQLLKEDKKVYIDCYESFIVPRDSSGISEVIKFKEEYVTAADNIINGDMVGIHIRRTDHELSKRISPVEMFVEKMDNEIAGNNSVKFFLSTDDKEVENELFGKYGEDRIIVQHDKKWGRTSKEEMISGIIDCLCLSKCKKIYGSFSSQFSGFAAEYGNIPIEIIK